MRSPGEGLASLWRSLEVSGGEHSPAVSCWEEEASVASLGSHQVIIHGHSESDSQGKLRHFSWAEAMWAMALPISRSTKASVSLSWPCPCQQCTFTKDFTRSGLCPLPITDNPLNEPPELSAGLMGIYAPSVFIWHIWDHMLRVHIAIHILPVYLQGIYPQKIRAHINKRDLLKTILRTCTVTLSVC